MKRALGWCRVFVWANCTAMFLSVTLVSGSIWATAVEPIHFHDLNDVLDQAASLHPDVVKAQNALQAAEEEIVARSAVFSPRISLDGTALQLRWQEGQWVRSPTSMRVSANKSTPIGVSATFSMGFSANNGTVRVPSWSVGLNYPLFRSAQLTSDNMNIRQAEMAVEIARRQLFKETAGALVDTIQRVHAAVTSTHQLLQAETAFGQALQRSDTVQRAVEDGFAPSTEILDSEMDLLRRQLQLQQSVRAYESNVAAVYEVMGLATPETGRTQFNWLELPPPEPYVAALDRDSMKTAAVSFDPTVWQRLMAVETARLQLQAEKERSGLEASLSSSVSKGRTQDTERDDTPLQWNVQVQVSYALADGGSQKRAINTRVKGVDEAQQAYDDAVQELHGRMNQMFIALDEAMLNMRIAILAHEKTEAEAETVLLRYTLGLADSSDVLAAEQNVQRAYDDYQSSVLNVFVALWNVNITAGLWPDFTVIMSSTDVGVAQ